MKIIELNGNRYQLWSADDILTADFIPDFPNLWVDRDLNAPYVYFLLAHDPRQIYLSLGNASFVKIGVAIEPIKRETAISTSSPLTINLWKCTRGGYPLEKKIHTYLREYRVNGEWFEMNPLIESVIHDAPDDMPEITW